MNNRKIQSGEQKLVNLINDTVKDSNLTYSNIKDKIVVENTKETKESSDRNHHLLILRYVAICSVMLAFIVIFAIAISTQPLVSNLNLTNYVMNYDDLFNYSHNNLLKETGLYSVIDDQQKLINTKVVELVLPSIDEGEIYCAYLSKDTIKKLENYPIDNDYSLYKQFIAYRGVDELIAKYYYYCCKEDCDLLQIDDNLKWVKYRNLNIKSQIQNYTLVFTSVIREAKEVYDIDTQRVIDVEVRCVIELDSNAVTSKNIEYDVDGGRYLFNIFEDTSKEQFFNEEYFKDNSALIETIDGKKVIKGVVPAWYDDSSYSDIYNEYNPTEDYQIKLKGWLDELNEYLLFSKDYEKRGSQVKIQVNYYDYSVVEYLVK